jgi:hypothetical protein
MKKLIFYVSIIISIVLLINVVKILVSDFNRLTDYGFGYLIGKIILLLIFIMLLFLIKKSIKKQAN